MGVGEAKTRGGATIVHAFVFTDWPRELFEKLTEYRQIEQGGKHGSGFPSNCILLHWSGSHLTENSKEDAVSNGTLYLFLQGTPARNLLAEYLCMFLGVLAQEGKRLVRGNYLSPKSQKGQIESFEALVERLWLVVSDSFGVAKGEDEADTFPTPEQYRKQYRRFGLPVPKADIPPAAEKKVEQYPDLEDEIIELSKRGVAFIDMESIKAKNHQDVDALRSILDELRDAGVITDYDETYSDDSGIATFTVLSEQAGDGLKLRVDSDKVGAIIESVREGENMAVTVTENKIHGTTRETHGVKVKWFHHVVEVITADGSIILEEKSFEDACETAARIAASIDKGVSVNEAVAPYANLITD